MPHMDMDRASSHPGRGRRNVIEAMDRKRPPAGTRDLDVPAGRRLVKALSYSLAPLLSRGTPVARERLVDASLATVRVCAHTHALQYTDTVEINVRDL